jgi:hypothetical protein
MGQQLGCVAPPPEFRSKIYSIPLAHFIVLPESVEQCLQKLEHTKLPASILFAPAHAGDLSFVADKIENGDKVDWNEVNLQSAASFIKIFLQNLPEPLIPFDLSWKALRAMDSFHLVFGSAPGEQPDNFDQLMYIRSLLANLPPIHYAVLRRLVATFAKVVVPHSPLLPAPMTHLSAMVTPGTLDPVSPLHHFLSID